MSRRFDRCQPGTLFNWGVDVGDPRIEVLAAIVVAEPVLHVRDIAVFTAGTEPGRPGPLSS